MNRYSKQSVGGHWRVTLTVIVAGAAWWSVVSSVPAQESESPALIASLSVATIQPEVILSHVREPTDWPVEVHRGKSADTVAWERFEAEFRPQQLGSSSIKRQIETAKYNLDTTMFALDRFIKSIRDHADLEFDRGFRRTRANSGSGFWGNPRVKLDLNLTPSKPYIGARVVIPFGN